MMVALNFKDRFVDDVLYGEKKQSIRRPRLDGRPHCKVGDPISLYTGQRTKNCMLLRKAIVTDLKPVHIDYSGIVLDGHVLPEFNYQGGAHGITKHDFAVSDGFFNFSEMTEFFKNIHGLPFDGVVIYWE